MANVSQSRPEQVLQQPKASDSLQGWKIKTRATSREEKNLQGFLEQPKEKWVESAFEVDGPHYFTVLALHILSPEQWRATRVEILRRLLVTSQARAVAPGGATRLTDKAVKDYSAYRSSLLFWALVDLIYNMFKKVPTSNTEGGWSCSLAEYIRHKHAHLRSCRQSPENLPGGVHASGDLLRVPRCGR
ncbi:hypothetical protein H8959_001749, partial [Pygathrix nigripes]